MIFVAAEVAATNHDIEMVMRLRRSCRDGGYGGPGHWLIASTLNLRPLTPKRGLSKITPVGIGVRPAVTGGNNEDSYRLFD